MKNQEKMNSKKRSSKVWLWFGVVVGLGLLVTGLALGFPGQSTAQSTTSLPLEVSVAQAAELRQQGALILDVRQPEEWQEVHIPGATLIPLGELEIRISELPRDQQIVVVCRSGNRSATGRDILLEAGFDQVTSMAGGVRAWQAAGYETASGD